VEDMTEIKGRLKMVEDNIQEIKLSIVRMEGNIGHIIETIKEFPCKQHITDNQNIEIKLASLRAEALLKAEEAKSTALIKAGELTAAALLKVDKSDKEHEERFVAIEKRQDGQVTTWRTITGSVALLALIFEILYKTGILK